MRKLLVALFAVVIIGTGIVGMTHEPEPNEIMEDESNTTIISSQLDENISLIENKKGKYLSKDNSPFVILFDDGNVYRANAPVIGFILCRDMDIYFISLDGAADIRCCCVSISFNIHFRA